MPMSIMFQFLYVEMTMTAPSVSEYMSTKPIHIKEDDALSLVISIFERTRISGAPVVNAKGEYVGVLSKTDLVNSRLLEQAQNLGTMTAKDFMCREKPITISPDTPLAQAVDMMLKHQVHRIFVSDAQGQITGVLSSFDVMRAIRTGNVSSGAAAAAPKGEQTKAASSDKEKELERRIFSLVSQKQEQIMQNK